MSTPSGSADALVQRLRDTLAARADEPSEVLVHERVVGAQPPRLGVLRPRLPAPLARALLRQGITQLYAHQVATVEALRAGDNVVLASPTASGKSLAFALPTLERVLTAPSTRALYLYPTKALIGDQLRALQTLVGALPPDVQPRPPRIACAAAAAPSGGDVRCRAGVRRGIRDDCQSGRAGRAGGRPAIS
ncbi:MAG: DEAD/DEAH box helicase [Chloroflexi bacterium]|nr:DEAD/DEAH box helicase [Chloroflexota bacterium]